MFRHAGMQNCIARFKNFVSIKDHHAERRSITREVMEMIMMKSMFKLMSPENFGGLPSPKSVMAGCETDLFRLGIAICPAGNGGSDRAYSRIGHAAETAGRELEVHARGECAERCAGGMMPGRGHSMAKESLRAVCLVAAVIWAGASVAAESGLRYPNRPIRMLVPSAPGGGTDNVARIVGPKLSEILGYQVVIDNRAGAGGSIAAQLASRAPADGYTLLATFATHATNPAIMKDLPYDLERDFVPISLVVILPNLLVANPSLPVHDVQGLIKFARSKPGKLQFASGSYGASSHLSMELLLGMTNTKMVSVPYKGVGPALTGVIVGEVPLMIGSMVSALPHVRSGRLVGLGVTSARRASAAPDIPTIAESGVPGYQADNWSGLLAPAGTPRAIVMTLHSAMTQAMNDPDVRTRFLREGAEPAPSRTPEEFGVMIKAELVKWTKVARDAGLKPL